MLLQPIKNNAQRVQTSQSVSIPAPVKGWNARDSLANMPEDFAVSLENVFPNLTSCDLRSGYLAQHRQRHGGCRDTRRVRGACHAQAHQRCGQRHLRLKRGRRLDVYCDGKNERPLANDDDGNVGR